jgi:outer membrane lipoprotein
MRIIERKRTIILFAVLAMLLSGCASTLSERIARPPAVDLGLPEARTDIEAHTGQTIRWGGTIVAVENEAEESRLEIIARPLRRDGRPRDADTSPGRFIAVVGDFLDPAIFVEGRDITIYGTITGQRAGRIGEREYIYPVVDVIEYQLWRVIDPRDYPPNYRIYYYDPWYSPWGPYYHPFPRYRDPPLRTPERRGILRQ